MTQPGPETAHHVTQGNYAVGETPDSLLVTVLGSCVTCCLHDPERKIGGMNHFLLPASNPRDFANLKYGAYAMELLVNALLKRGAHRGRLVAKLFGGAKIVPGLTDVGTNNAQFAIDFLENEDIPCIGQSLGGTQARTVRFWPYSGRVQQRLVSEKMIEMETAIQVKAEAPVSHKIDLF